MFAIIGLVFGAVVTTVMAFIALPLAYLAGVVVPFKLTNIFWNGFNNFASSNLVNLTLNSGNLSSQKITSLTATNGTVYDLKINFDFNDNIILKVYAIIAVFSVFILIFSIAVAYARKSFIKLNIGDSNLSPALAYVLYFFVAILVVPVFFFVLNLIVSVFVQIVTTGIFNSTNRPTVNQESINKFFEPFNQGVKQDDINAYIKDLERMRDSSSSNDAIKQQINQLISMAQGTGTNKFGFGFLSAEQIELFRSQSASNSSEISQAYSNANTVLNNLRQSQTSLNSLISSYGGDWSLSNEGETAYNNILSFYNGFLGARSAATSSGGGVSDFINVAETSSLFPLIIPLHKTITGTNGSDWDSINRIDFANIFDIDNWVRLSAGVIVASSLLTFMLRFVVNVVMRLYIIIGLLVFSPFMIAFGTIDYGYRARQWLSEVIKAFFGLFVIYFITVFFVSVTTAIVNPVIAFSDRSNDGYTIWRIGFVIPLVLAMLFGADMIIKYVNKNLSVGRILKNTGSKADNFDNANSNSSNAGGQGYRRGSEAFSNRIVGTYNSKDLQKFARNSHERFKNHKAGNGFKTNSQLKGFRKSGGKK
ncbi:hypothetical protein [[Mycoplasma] testudinis]|uniref:hypothetical protein n=1 Tax=[Mycoplasma] testudinis TaxID=33924 RepID=UPI0004826605|nr:hypothetical protein [[Mycoplasma] testudinis]